MLVRDFDSDKDYETLVDWWNKQGWPALPKQVLTGKGLVVENENTLMAATWVFATNCPIYIMEWTVANPEINWEERAKAIKLVTDAACDWAKQDGAIQLFTMTKSERFIEKLQELSFTKADSGMTHLVRRL